MLSYLDVRVSCEYVKRFAIMLLIRENNFDVFCCHHLRCSPFDVVPNV